MYKIEGHGFWKVFVFLSAFFLTVFVCGISWAGTWQEQLEENFDIAETFNGLQDWYGTKYSPDDSIKEIFSDNHPDDFPKKVDGTPSVWGYYSKANDPSGGEKYWIGNFGKETYFGAEGKSAVIDLSNIRGPSRLGTYFGNGESNSGYEEIYIFYMIKVTSNQWPTQCEKDGKPYKCQGDVPLGIYEHGQDYAFWASWKFNSIGSGFNSPRNWNGSVIDPNHPYGDSEIVPYIRLYNYGPIPRLDGKEGQIKNNLVLNMEIRRISQPGTEAELVSSEDVRITEIRENTITWACTGCALIADEWMGVEFQYTLEDPAGSGNGEAKAWIYNKNGESKQAFSIKGVNFLPKSGQGHKFNRFFFGGNNSYSYTWGPTMEAPYYVDDFIIHKSRIGPTYFGLLKGNEVLAAPANLRITAVGP